jgi:hypothetical protein
MDLSIHWGSWNRSYVVKVVYCMYRGYKHYKAIITKDVYNKF